MEDTRILASKSFSQAYKTLRNSFYLLLCLTTLTMLSCLVIVIFVFRSADRKVYVVSPTSVMQAVSDYDHQTSIYEMRNHVKVFCSEMFAWDKDNFNSNVENALGLADHYDGLKIFNTFKENEVYENLVSTSARVSVKIDSVIINSDHLPYQGKFFLAQTWTTAAGKQTQGIGASFQLVPISRSESNPYGLSIQKINFFQYQPTFLRDSSKAR